MFAKLMEKRLYLGVFFAACRLANATRLLRAALRAFQKLSFATNRLESPFGFLFYLYIFTIYGTIKYKIQNSNCIG